MNHATTCSSKGGGIGIPDAPADAFNADACLESGVSPLPGSAALATSAEQVRAAAASLGIDPARFEPYAVRRWGRGWHLHADGRRQALDEMERYRNDPEGFIDKIDTYLRLKGWSERGQGG